MHIIGLARLGKDAEIRFTNEGKAVANIALAFNYGKKDQDGKRPTQWVDAALFGDRAEKLAPYLLKGTLVDVHLADPHIETYTTRDGASGSKMVAMVNHLEFASPPPASNGQQQQQRQAPQQTQQRQAQPSQQRTPTRSFADDGIDADDIPF